MKHSNTYIVAAATFVAVTLLSGCGGSSDGEGPSASGAEVSAIASAAPSAEASAATAVPASVQANIDAAIPGTYTLPEPTGPITPGKKVTGIVFGNQSQAGPIFTESFKAAGAAAGWTVNVVDGEFSTDLYLSAVRQAIAEKVDGIVLFVIDCAAVKAGVEEAQAAGIPVIYAEGYDCDSDGQGKATGYPLGLYNSLTEQGVDYVTFLEATGQLQADAMISALDAKVDALAVNYPETYATVSITEGFMNEMKVCPTCTATVFDAVYADWGNALQTKISTELLKNPTINAIMGNYDDPVLNGIAAAAAASDRDIYVTGEAGYPGMIDLIRQGKADMTIGYDGAMESWAAIERLNRIFNGDTEPFNIGVGLQLIDVEHNMPPEGEMYVAPVDYIAAYTAAWGAS
jgi:ribose transport system substrate-binding protein